MSRKSKRRAQVMADVDMGTITPEQAQAQAEAIEKAPPYHAEERAFGLFGMRVDAAAIAEYINTFSQAHDAALLQMIPTAPGSFLFVWDMQ
jgi:hypothetical protein